MQKERISSMLRINFANSGRFGIQMGRFCWRKCMKKLKPPRWARNVELVRQMATLKIRPSQWQFQSIGPKQGGLKTFWAIGCHWYSWGTGSRSARCAAYVTSTRKPLQRTQWSESRREKVLMVGRDEGDSKQRNRKRECRGLCHLLVVSLTSFFKFKEVKRPYSTYVQQAFPSLSCLVDMLIKTLLLSRWIVSSQLSTCSIEYNWKDRCF